MNVMNYNGFASWSRQYPALPRTEQDAEHFQPTGFSSGSLLPYPEDWYLDIEMRSTAVRHNELTIRFVFSWGIGSKSKPLRAKLVTDGLSDLHDVVFTSRVLPLLVLLLDQLSWIYRTGNSLD